MPDLGASRARLVQLLTSAVQTTGLELEDVTVSSAGRRKVVRVVIDVGDVRDGAGISLDDIAAVSRVVSDLLDTPEGDELLAGAYTLEVTSPGVDRPLTEARHWRRNVGRLVKVTLADGSSVTGRVLEVDDAQVTLDVEGTARTVLRAEVGTAQVQVEFTHPAEGDT